MKILYSGKKFQRWNRDIIQFLEKISYFWKKILRWKCDIKHLEKIIYLWKNILRWKFNRKHLEKTLYPIKMRYIIFGENFILSGKFSDIKMRYKTINRENFIVWEKFLWWKYDIKYMEKILYLGKNFEDENAI